MTCTRVSKRIYVECPSGHGHASTISCAAPKMTQEDIQIKGCGIRVKVTHLVNGLCYLEVVTESRCSSTMTQVHSRSTFVVAIT